MARIEEDREDLFAELGTYSLRWELRLPQESLPVVLARRGAERVAIYFGQDPCFHFNGAGELMRSFAGGYLYRTQGTTLARLQRRRTPGETQLLRQDLRESELQEFLQQSELRIHLLVESLLEVDESASLILRATDRSEKVLRDAAQWIAERVLPLRLAPPYPTRRQ